MGRRRVCGAKLGKEIGNRVTLFGLIKGVSSNQMNVELSTPDNIKVNVSLPEPYFGLADGIMEVFGTVKSKSTISADSYLYFTSKDLETFKTQDYQDFAVLLGYLMGQDPEVQAFFHTP
ncbi:uncharacterized protein [Fopius arisanus]|uniref:Uncharacterized protein n=1 Tax=Fopius arisanus TaxID=64838 RepID=A0A9R1U7S8_9HYME|nr:PREDICTED: uncharacterized protein LOC105270947 [Fopius arisanus]